MVKLTLQQQQQLPKATLNDDNFDFFEMSLPASKATQHDNNDDDDDDGDDGDDISAYAKKHNPPVEPVSIEPALPAVNHGNEPFQISHGVTKLFQMIPPVIPQMYRQDSSRFIPFDIDQELTLKRNDEKYFDFYTQDSHVIRSMNHFQEKFSSFFSKMTRVMSQLITITISTLNHRQCKANQIDKDSLTELLKQKVSLSLLIASFPFQTIPYSQIFPPHSRHYDDVLSLLNVLFVIPIKSEQLREELGQLSKKLQSRFLQLQTDSKQPQKKETKTTPRRNGNDMSDNNSNSAKNKKRRLTLGKDENGDKLVFPTGLSRQMEAPNQNNIRNQNDNIQQSVKRKKKNRQSRENPLVSLDQV
jgi:hypothetical protein